MLRRDLDRVLNDYPLTTVYLALALWVTVLLAIMEAR